MSLIYSEQDCLAALLQYQEERKEIPTRSGYMTWCVEKSVPSAGVLIRELAPESASWDQVLEKLEVKPEKVKQQRSAKHSSYTVTNCKNAVQSCAIDLGHSPQMKEYDSWRKKRQDKTPSALTIVRLADPLFPQRQSWKAALKHLELDTESIPKRTIVNAGIVRDVLELESGLLQCATDLDEVPSSYAYDSWRQERLSYGDSLATQTTLRRRLAPEENSWAAVLGSVGLDASKISSVSKQKRREKFIERAKQSLQSFAETFDGLAPLSLYLRWSMLDPNRSSVNSIIYWLASKSRSWQEALATAEVDHLERISSEQALLTNVHLPTLASRTECSAAVALYVEQNRSLPTVQRYRVWQAENANLPSDQEIVFQFDNDTWRWATAIDNARATQCQAAEMIA